MDSKEKKIRKAYEKASQSGKSALEFIYPELNLANKPIKERVKTFEDALAVLGDDNPLANEYNLLKALTERKGKNLSTDLTAYLKLRIICAALNEGWEPQFTEDETRYYPWFWLYNEDDLINEDKDNELKEYGLISTDKYRTEYAGFASACSIGTPSTVNANIGSRLCLKTPELARYCGTYFSDIWADFNLIRK